MSPGEQRLIEYIASRLESMLRRPAVWGSNLAIEQRVLQLLEMRWLVLDPAARVEDSRRVVERFVAFIGEAIPNGTNQPLAVQLEQTGRQDEFTHVLGRFVEQELARWVAEGREAVGAVPGEEEVEKTARLIELVRSEEAARARRAPRPPATPITFAASEPRSP